MNESGCRERPFAMHGVKPFGLRLREGSRDAWREWQILSSIRWMIGRAPLHGVGDVANVRCDIGDYTQRKLRNGVPIRC